MSDDASMRIVGRLRASPLERFGRNLRRAAKLAEGAGERRGTILRFSSWSDVEAWKKNRHRMS